MVRVSRNTLLASLAATVFLPVATRVVLAQNPSPSPSSPAEPSAKTSPAFEVVSIHPNLRGGIAGFLNYPGGRIRCEYCRVEWLVWFAFDVQSYQVEGGPDWIHHEAYSIEAIPPASSELTKFNPPMTKTPLNEEQRLMLQSMLADRFEFKFHRETRTGDVYVLTRGKGKLDLQPPKDPTEFSWAGPSGDGMQGMNISMPELAFQLSGLLHRRVLDETGIKGSFDFKYAHSTSDSDWNADDLVSTVTASLQGVGLKLKSAKGPVEMIVIDHIEHPSPN